MARVGQGMGYLARVEANQTGRRRRGAEGGADRMGRMAPRAVAAADQETGDAAADVVADDDGPQECLPGGILPLGHGQGRGNDRASRMGERGAVLIVRLVGVAHEAVDHRGVDGRGQEIGPEDLGLRGPSLAADKFRGHFAGFQPGPRDHGGDRIQDVMLGFFRHLCRQGFPAGLGDVLAETGHDGLGGHGVLLPRIETILRCRFEFCQRFYGAPG